ncbi:MAG: hypothetical protein P8Y44_06885 [Acidobacteriota bacterium]
MRTGRSGHALLVAMIVVLIVASAAALIFSHYTLQTRISLQQSRQVRLIALNDAALAEALAHLAENEGFRGKGPHEFAGGEISSVVRSLGDGRRQIEATSAYLGWTRHTRLEITMVAGGPRVDSWAIDRHD